MERLLIAGAFLLMSLQGAFAQERTPLLFLGYTHTLTPYVEDGVLDGFSAGISWPLAAWWSLNLQTGYQSGRYTTSGRTFGGAGDVLLWDNSYAYSQSERLAHLDVLIHRELIAPESRFGLRLGAGAGLIYQHYRYPEEVVLFRGEILSRTDRSYRAWKPSVLLSLEGDVRIIGPWHLQGGIAWRPTLRQVADLTYRSSHDFGQGGPSVSTRDFSGLAEWFTHFHLGLGYRF
jgi:hypothetical protein